ncbi:MAG: hypothetical protein H0X26_08265 [Alphaproteobacteria bacterium]|nr:hypothetical protein [Alphaproteobacteria bacterium]
MSLRYNKIKNHPTTFKRLFGVTIDELECIVQAVGARMGEEGYSAL